MGNRNKNTLIPKVLPPDYTLKLKYGKNEDFFKVFDKQLAFKSFNYEEVIFLLNKYNSSIENQSSLQIDENLKKNSNLKETSFSYLESIKIENIQILFNRRILKNVLSSNYTNNENILTFNQSFIKHFSCFMYKTYRNFNKIEYNDKSKMSIEYIPKLILIPFILQNTNGSYRNKLNFLFNILCNESSQVSIIDYRLKVIFFFLLMCPSGISLLILNEIANEDENTRKVFPEEEFVRIYDMYQVKDGIRNMKVLLLKLFKTNSFDNNKILNFNEFTNSFIENGFLFLFSNSGVREYMETNND